MTFFFKNKIDSLFKESKIIISVSIILIFASFYTSAQNNPSPTFEETVSYIISNTKGRVMYPGALDAYSRVKGYTLKDISIDKNGKINFVTEQKSDYNDFTISFNVFDLVASTEYPEGVIAKDFIVHFNGLNVSSGYGIAYATQNDALKVARAFRHLRKVCEKPVNDLFSQPVAAEKKILNKNETLQYINKNILPGLRIGSCDCYILENYSTGWSNGSRSKNNGVANFFVSEQEFSNSFTYWANSRSDNEYCEESPYFNEYDDLVSGPKLPQNLKIEFKFNILDLESFEVEDINSDINSKVLKLIFKNYNCTTENLSDIYLPQGISISTSNSLKLRVKIDNIEKLKKAFLHLQTLMIEEKNKEENDDPFGE